MEHDMREKAKNAMRLVLEAARFEVEEVDEPLDLSAIRDSTSLLVLHGKIFDTVIDKFEGNDHHHDLGYDNRKIVL